ncbi:hypothetical protein [Burkholderia sp. Ac-20365]|nr:hypothetical protein [Burkholderia sp. Ac-20365]MBN3765821.1 AraC family transcriptional regulator [Burkholderia sp. Ac-20365]
MPIGTPKISSSVPHELYQSASAFISMFRKALGYTPQRYLRRPECA